MRTPNIPTSLIDVEPVIFRPRALATDVPFTSIKGLVSLISECLGNRNLGSSQSTIVLRWQMCVMPASISPCFSYSITYPSGDTMICWIFTGHNTRPGRTADLTRGVTTGEFHPFTRDTIDVRTFVVFRPLVTQVLPSEVISKNKQNIWPNFGL